MTPVGHVIVPRTRSTRGMRLAGSLRILGSLGRVCAGAVFLFAAISKGIDPRELVSAITFLLPSSPHTVEYVVKFLILTELVIGALLVFGVASTTAAIAAIGLLTLFTSWLIYLTANGIEIGCGCGLPTTWLRLGDERASAIARNAGLLVLLATSVFGDLQCRRSVSSVTGASPGPS